MLFYVKYIRHDVEKLHELLVYFFEKVEEYSLTKFDNSLLPDWYSKSTNKLSKLEKQLKEFLKFSPEDKKSIIEAFNRANQIQLFFSNKTGLFEKIPVGLDFIKKNSDGTIDNSIETFLNKLFVDNLYNIQLGKKDGTFSKKIGENLSSHYIKLKEEQSYYDESFTICPFCGIESLKLIESEGRPDYDHLLPKGFSLFIFSAINLRNLVPIGERCNSKKSSKHLLYLEQGRITRTLAFYPYDPPPNPFELYYFKLTCTELPSMLNGGGSWKVDIIPHANTDPQTIEKINTWDRVFNIKNRYAEYIKERFKFLLELVINAVNINNPNLLDELRIGLNLLLTTRFLYEYNFISNEDGLVPKRIFIEWILQQESYLMTYLEKKRHIPPFVDMDLMEEE